MASMSPAGRTIDPKPRYLRRLPSPVATPHQIFRPKEPIPPVDTIKRKWDWKFGLWLTLVRDAVKDSKGALYP